MKKIIIRVHCPKCETGELLSTGQGFSNSAGTRFVYKCNLCKDPHSLVSGEGPREFIEYDECEIEERWESLT